MIRKEMLDHLLSLRFIALSVIGVFVIWLSLYNGYVYYQDGLKDDRLARASTEDRIREINVIENWSEFVYVGYLEHKAPTAMSIFIRGLEPTMGRSISNTTTGVRRLSRSPMEVNPYLGVFPTLDLGLAVQVILSLFVLLLTYDAVCGEKEAGTLRLTASFSVPRHHLLLGKLLGALIPVLAAFGLPLLLGCAVVLLMPDASFFGPEFNRLCLILLGFALYLTTFTCAGLLASCLTHRSATAFVLLLTFWAVSVVILPRLGLITADSIRPAPSIYELEAEQDAVTKSNLEKQRHLLRQWDQQHSQTGQVRGGTLEGQEARRLFWGKVRREVLFSDSRLQHKRLEEAFSNRYNLRLDLAVALARLSPTFAFNNAMLRLAGTGLDRQQRFLAAANAYFKQHQDWFSDTWDRDELRKINPRKYGGYKWDISDMPRLVYRETWPEEEVQAALVDIGVLALWGLLFFAGSYAAMLRYDLR